MMPRVTGTTDPQKGLSARFYPDDMIRQDEQVKYADNPSRWLSPGPYVFSGILLIFSLIISIAVPLGYGEQLLDVVTPSVLDLSVPNTWWYAPLLFTAAAIVLLLHTVLMRASTWHVVTDKRILHRENVLAPTRNRLDLVDVNSIDCRQPLPERWYNVGHIDIYTASTGGKELVFAGVKEAPSIANGIDQLRYDYQQRIRGGYPEGGDPDDETPPERSPQQEGEPQARQHNQDPRNQRRPGNERSASRDGRSRTESQRRGHSADSRPREGRAEGPSRRDDQQSDSTDEPLTDPFEQEGDSIEEQRPDHTLRDDIDDSFRGEDD